MNMDYAIEVIDVSKSFKDHTVLKNINLTVNKGEICGIIGRNGSGKTVLLKCICKIFLEDSGEIYILGENTTKTPSIIKNLGVLIETPAFLENFSGYWNLKFLADFKYGVGIGTLYDEKGNIIGQKKMICNVNGCNVVED